MFIKPANCRHNSTKPLDSISSYCHVTTIHYINSILFSSYYPPCVNIIRLLSCPNYSALTNVKQLIKVCNKGYQHAGVFRVVSILMLTIMSLLLCIILSVITHGVMSKHYLPVKTNIINIQSVPIMTQELLTLPKQKNMNNVVLVEFMFKVSSCL